MATVAESLAYLETVEQQRAARAKQSDALRVKHYLQSREWRSTRYRFMAAERARLCGPLRCQACGRTSREVSLAIDHVVPLLGRDGKINPEGWRRRNDWAGGLQVLCSVECNWQGKGRRDDDWRDDKIEAQP